MSKESDRHTVFQTTRVRNSLKNDVCWIHKSKEEEESRTDHAVETRPALVKQNSYVLSTAKKFESIDSPLSPPLENTQFSPSDGDSSNQANSEVIPPQEDAPPEGSTVETTDDAKPQAPTEELIQKDEAHPEKTVANKTAENKEEYAAVYQSNVEQNGVAAADVSADAHVEDPAAETSAVPAVKLKYKEEPATKTEPANATQLEHVGVQSIVHPAEGSCEKGPPEQAAEEIVEAVAEVAVEATSAEPVLKTEAKEVVQCEVQPVDNPVVEQSVEPERAADHVVELTIKDAVEPVTSSDAEAAQDEFSDRLIELSEALDVELPTTEAAPEPLKDQKQSHTEEIKLNQHSDDSNMSKEVPQSTQSQDETRNINVCSFCENIIHGNVKIYLSEPVVTCHPDCLKCGVCAKALGDMLTPMFLYDQVVQCGGCFQEALKTRT